MAGKQKSMKIQRKQLKSFSNETNYPIGWMEKRMKKIIAGRAELSIMALKK